MGYIHQGFVYIAGGILRIFTLGQGQIPKDGQDTHKPLTDKESFQKDREALQSDWDTLFKPNIRGK